MRSRPEPVRTWRRDRRGTPLAEEQPPRCGGPDYTAAERAELRARAEAEQRARAEAEAEERRAASRARAGRRPVADAADVAAADDPMGEEPAKDAGKDTRYAVTLLREDDAWGGG
ncbi:MULTISPECIES: hypothetical protein [Micromonospora]|uniref:hypothetical protein n=1 Tax=unclassified Micromonospora TaxID=2617518 RepID=UPI001E3423F4|nr:hypothetical protein [Micromonospora sp. NBRC 110038]